MTTARYELKPSTSGATLSDADTFRDSTLLITGGTGSFGNAVLRRFLSTNIQELRIFSRDEKKQDDMRRKYNDDRVKFYVGDVRDQNSIADAMRNVDYCFHAAALKQVPSCEFYPIEAVRTNVLGTENVLRSAIGHGVRRVVVLSTDKAVYPVNAMGMSKALMEKTMIAMSRNLPNDTMICGTRYGNVMASRGSVIPLFAEQMLAGRPITVTDRRMTRFMMTLDNAVELVLYAFANGSNGDIFVQKSPAATLDTLVSAMRVVMDKPVHPVVDIGTRHGEKLYESLLSREEVTKAVDLGEYFRVASDDRDLNYTNYFEVGKQTVDEAVDYNSHNTHQLDVDGMAALLRQLPSLTDAERPMGATA